LEKPLAVQGANRKNIKPRPEDGSKRAQVIRDKSTRDKGEGKKV
jgi:hypothetical protein